MKLDKLTSFNNFRGLFTKDESGLVPSDSDTGVYASEIQNVVCKDGTIRPVGGYYPEEDDGTVVTFIPTVAAGTEYFTGGTSYTMMNGDNRRVLWGDDGVAFAYNEGLKRYEVLLDFSAEVTAPPNITSAVYSNIQASTPFKDTLWFAADSDGPYYYWNSARGVMTGLGPTTITISSQADMDRFYPDTSAGGVLALTAGGITYTYTNIVGTQFQGVSPDPTLAFDAGTFPISAAIFQKPVQDLGTISSALGGDPNIYFWYKGRLGLASTTRSNVVLSEVGDPFSYTYRGAGGYVAVNIGDGGGATKAVMTLKDTFVVGKRDALVAVQIKQETANNEYTKIANIVNRKNIGPIHENAWASGENEVYYISIDKDFKRIKQLNDGTEFPISETVNEDIEPTFRGFDFSKCRMQYFENSVYIACISDGDENDTVIEYDTVKDTYYIHAKPVAGWVVHDNKLYFSTPYDLSLNVWTKGEDGVFDDNNASVASLWKSGRLKFGDQFRMKNTTLFAVYLRMTELTTVNCQLDFNNMGSLYTTNFDIRGDGTSAAVTGDGVFDLHLEELNGDGDYLTEDGDTLTTEGSTTTTNVPGFYIISTPITSSYGTNVYGIAPYGSRNMALNDEGMFDVVIFKTLPVKYKPHDVTVTFSCNDVGQNYRIIDFGFVEKAEESVPKKAMAQ